MSMKKFKTEEEYRAFDAVSSTRLKEALKSLDRYFNFKKKEVTRAMELGTAFHQIILEPEKFREGYKVYEKPIPDKNMNKKENKDALQELKNKFPNAKIITREEFYDFENMASAIFSNEESSRLIKNAAPNCEVGLAVEHNYGIWIKALFDGILIEENFVQPFDLKKTQDNSDEGILRYCKSYHLIIQAALYEMVAEKYFTGKEISPMKFICVEEGNANPKDVRIFSFTKKQLGEVKKWIDDKITEIFLVKETGISPHGYSDKPSEIVLPEYYLNKMRNEQQGKQ